MDEFALIQGYFAHLTPDQTDGTGLLLGIGDDAALCAPPPGQVLAVSTDTLVAGRHFPLHTDPYAVGWKAMAVNVSDLAAMGARPVFVLLALSLPAPDRDWLAAFCAGVQALCAQEKIQLIGGDTTRSPVLSLTVTALGWVPAGQAITRHGARPGDVVVVSGALGGAAHALRHLGSPAQARLDLPQPRTALGLALRGVATAMLDVSDGLLQDLQHVLSASGAGAQLQLEQIPLDAALQDLPIAEALALACTGGDDYELCFTVPPTALGAVQALSQSLGLALNVIGRVEAQPGLRLLWHGQPFEMQIQGFNHFG